MQTTSKLIQATCPEQRHPRDKDRIVWSTERNVVACYFYSPNLQTVHGSSNSFVPHHFNECGQHQKLHKYCHNRYAISRIQVATCEVAKLFINYKMRLYNVSFKNWVGSRPIWLLLTSLVIVQETPVAQVQQISRLSCSVPSEPCYFACKSISLSCTSMLECSLRHVIRIDIS